VALTPAGTAVADPPQGSIVGWGRQVIGVDLSEGFISVAAGYYHSLCLKADGSIVAWGDNSVGQTSVPTPNTSFLAVAAGEAHSLGLKADGSIVAWGWNYYGQTNVPSPNTGFIAVAAGGFHSLGLKADGSLVAWGYNGHGQSSVPVPNTGFIAVAAGRIHSLALKADGSIVAWGSSSQTNVPTPNSGFIAIAAGAGHSLALKADGSIMAWGGNYYGQTNVPALNSGFIAVAAGGDNSLAIRQVVEDADGDGVVDPDDNCPVSDVGETIAIDKCETGITNEVSDEGCTRADAVAACAEEARNHGQFVQCVALLANGWKRSAAITDTDRGRINRCAARAGIPLSDDQQAIGPNRAARRLGRSLQPSHTQHSVLLSDQEDGIHKVPGTGGTVAE